MTRLKNAFLVFIWAFKHPTSIANFEVLSAIYGLLLDVASKQQHRMTKLCFVDCEDGSEFVGVSIWAGAGEDSCPTKRIAELLEQNKLLLEQIQFLEDQLK